MPRQIDDMQRAPIAQRLDQRREYAAVHRPAMQQHEMRVATAFGVDVKLVSLSLCGLLVAGEDRAEGIDVHA
jgi:hypothetical protein